MAVGIYHIPGENCSRTLLLVVVELSISLEAKLLLVAECTLPESSYAQERSN